MARFRNAVNEAQAHNRTLYIFIAVLCVMCAYMWYGWNNAPKTLTLYIPPDLSAGATIRPNQVNDANVFQFSYYIYQQLNRWREDGEKDYPQNIYNLQAYLSDGYRKKLEQRAQKKLQDGELQGRLRTLQLAEEGHYKPEYVKRVADGVWDVVLNVEIQERHKNTGFKIKDAVIRTPIRVVRANVDIERNPWGLVLDGGDESMDRVVRNNKEEEKNFITRTGQ